MDVELTCEMEHGCPNPVTHIDNKGWIYCTPHGVQRRMYRPCRRLRPHELNRLRRGLPVAHY